MDRVCNRNYVFEKIFTHFRLEDGNLYRKHESKGEWSICNGDTNRSSSGYKRVIVCGKRVLVHNIVAVIKTGRKIPDGIVCDHIDGNKKNNNASNIRLVTPTENNLNVRTHNKRSKSKHISIVERYPGIWRVKFKLNKMEIDLGQFASIDEAVHARDLAYKMLAPIRYQAISA